MVLNGLCYKIQNTSILTEQDCIMVRSTTSGFLTGMLLPGRVVLYSTRTKVFNFPLRKTHRTLMTTTLAPIRIDAVSDDTSLRIVETILWDPFCWPIPLLSHSNSPSSLDDAVEANVQLVAHQLISDLEVLSISS